MANPWPNAPLLKKELANVTAVWERIASHQDYAALDRVIPTLHNFYNAQSWFQESIVLFQFALTQIDKTAKAYTLSTAQARGYFEQTLGA
ncbi:MAG: hypothetical protein GY805_01135 [Chloroflexi bacterium]|nr:hypothetical protein [Chloroflexota bacterium]